MKSHFIQDKERGTYFRECPEHTDNLITWTEDAEGTRHSAIAPTKAEADLYEPEEAVALATKYYGKNGYAQGKWELIKATPSENWSWRSRRGGRANSDKQNRARKRTAQRFAGRPRVCPACGEAKIPARTPAKVTVCEDCNV